jgi:luciferase family oxidoreductase group 1
VLIAHLAGESERIRVGSGGIMLPNHSALKMAENFRMLETLFPGRIDLGIGRAPGGDRYTAYLLNPSNTFSEKDFLQQLVDLRAFIRGDATPGTVHEKIKAIPVTDTAPEFWMLTSSGGSGRIAAHFGMALSFAHFINPIGGPEVLRQYREEFHPSDELNAPMTSVGIFVFCSEDQQKIREWQAEFDYRLLHIESGNTGPLPPREAIMNIEYSPEQMNRILFNRARCIAGTPPEVKKALVELAEAYAVDEIVIATMAEEKADRFRSYELLAELFILPGQS